ncbi:hypothetical protein Bca101_027017 [Brassica carinata]
MSINIPSSSDEHHNFDQIKKYSLLWVSFWSYSVSEHTREDIAAMIEKIHEIKTSELRLYQPNVEEVIHEE